MKIIVIDRENWGRGRLRYSRRNSIIPSSADKKCCLGFVCEAYGIKPIFTINISFPSALKKNEKNMLPKWLHYESIKSDVCKVSRINDSSTYWSNKEKLLKPLFAEHGIKLVFRGKQ